MAKTPTDLGNQYGKPDVERVGLFSELPYMNGKGYVSPFPKPRPDKGRNIIGEGPKVKTGRQDCYFDKEFKRLFEGEAIEGRRKAKGPKRKNPREIPFIPPGNPKKHASPGDYYGTFGGKIEAFSNKRKPQPKHKAEPRNIIGAASKYGGCGYVDITLNPYPAHANERYGVKPKYKDYGKILDGPLVTTHYPKPFFEPNPFVEPEKVKPGPTYVRPKEGQKPFLPPGKFVPTGPAKLPGGCHAGCFDNFPEYKANKYLTVADLERPRKHVGGKFYPQSWGLKTFYTESTISKNTSFRVNVNNYHSYEPLYTKHLVD